MLNSTVSLMELGNGSMKRLTLIVVLLFCLSAWPRWISGSTIASMTRHYCSLLHCSLHRSSQKARQKWWWGCYWAID